MTVIIGFDLATNVGWCSGDGSRLPAVDSFRLPSTGSDVGSYLLEARGYFRALLDRFQPEHIVYEAPVRVENQALQIKLHGLPGILEMECVERGITPAMVYPSTIKARLAGHGHAKKPAMILAANNFLGRRVKTHDEADALGAWLCGVHHYAPALWPRWEARLRGLELP